jgi:hypothetical protein
MRIRRRGAFRLRALAVVGVFAPITISSEGIVPASACADGTCCPQVGADCIINNILVEEAYRKKAGGSCKGDDQPAPPL